MRLHGLKTNPLLEVVSMLVRFRLTAVVVGVLAACGTAPGPADTSRLAVPPSPSTTAAALPEQSTTVGSAKSTTAATTEEKDELEAASRAFETG